MGKPIDDVLLHVGSRLRELRRQRGVTLTEMAVRTGTSQSTLSRLESGQRRPTLELLLPLAREYGVPLDDLVGAPPTGDPRIYLKPVARQGYTLVPLTRRMGAIRAYKMVIPSTGKCAKPPLRTHNGHGWVFVLSGALRIFLGRNSYELSSGDAAEFDTTVPHAIGSADGRSVEVLMLVGAQGERVHVRAPS